MTQLKFVEDGFKLSEAKGGMGWIDIDHVFVQTDFGKGSMTDSGYPRIAKMWKRGTKLEDAKVIYEGKQTDMSVSAIHDDTPGFERNFVSRNLAFYNDELFHLRKDGTLLKIDAPNSSEKNVHEKFIASKRASLGWSAARTILLVAC